MSTTVWSTYDASRDVFIVPAANMNVLNGKATMSLYPTTLGASVVFFIIFIYFSSATQRRTIIFYIHLCAFTMLMGTSIVNIAWSDIRQKSFFVFPPGDLVLARRDRRFINSIYTLEQLTCFVADLALLWKVKSFYPSPLYSLKRKALIMGPLLILAPPRLILICFVSVFIALNQKSSNRDVVLSLYIVQLVYCSYATALMLAKSLAFYRATTTRGDHHLRRKFRLLIESIACTFLVPLGFQVACIVTVAAYQDPSVHRFGFYSSGNTFTSVHFALLSTTWSTIRSSTSSKPSEEAGPHLPSFAITNVNTGDEEAALRPSDLSKRISRGGVAASQTNLLDAKSWTTPLPSATSTDQDMEMRELRLETSGH